MFALHVCHSDGKQLYKLGFVLRLRLICIVCWIKSYVLKRKEKRLTMLDQQNWKLSEEKSVVVSLFFHSSSAKVLRRDLYLIAFLPDCRKLTRSRSVQCFNCVGIKSATNKTSLHF